MTETRKGELFVFSSAFMWAFFPIVTVLSYVALPSIVSLAWSTLLSGVFFGVVIIYRRSWREIAHPLLLKYVAGVALFTGVLFYVFYFLGLQYTTAGNAVLIAHMEVLTSFAFFHLIRKDAISTGHKLGIACMVAAMVLLLGKDFSTINIGDIFVLIAICAAPIGNMYQQKARALASAETVLFMRTVFATPVIFALAYLLHQRVSLSDIQAALPYLAVNGLLLLGLSKIFWVEAIHRISVTKAMALNTITPLLTLVFAWVLLGQMPTLWQAAAILPLFGGVLLLTDQIGLDRTE